MLAVSMVALAEKTVYVSSAKVEPVYPDTETQAYVPCGATDTLELTAVESDFCYTFTGWDLDGDMTTVEIPASQCRSSVLGGQRAYTYQRVVSNVGEDENYTAIFTIKEFKVTIGTDGNGDITINSK